MYFPFKLGYCTEACQSSGLVSKIFIASTARTGTIGFILKRGYWPRGKETSYIETRGEVRQFTLHRRKIFINLRPNHSKGSSTDRKEMKVT